MKITWVGHACLLVETAQTKCLTDPWLSDPIFGGSIRHIPPRAHGFDDIPAPDIICITHCHFDHFHEDTLRRIDKKTPIVIPWSPIREIKAELEKLGFTDVRQLKPWKSQVFRDLKITAVPSIGVPEEVAYVIEGEGKAVFDAADCVFEPIAEEIGKKFQLDIGFIPFCGWDHAGLMGMEPEKKWKPDYDALAKACREMGLRYVVPAASNAFWFPEELRWLNDRVCPGQATEFMDAVARIGDGKMRPLSLNPGDQWLGDGEKVLSAPHPTEAEKSPPPPSPGATDWQIWLKDPRLKQFTIEEFTESFNRLLKGRRNHLLKVLPRCPSVVWWMLNTKFELASFVDGKPVYWNIDFRRWNPVRMGGHDPSTHFGLLLAWSDLGAMVQGLVDSQDLVISQRMKMVYLPKSENFARVYGLEFVFFTRSLARSAA